MVDSFTYASGFSQYGAFSTYWDDTQVTYSAQYFNDLQYYDLPFNMSPQETFQVATSGFLQQQLQWIKQSAVMFAPAPYGGVYG